MKKSGRAGRLLAEVRYERLGVTAVNAKPIYLTTVQTIFHEGRKNYRVLFGTPHRCETQVCIEGLTRKVYQFAPSARFALDLWACNRYGTIEWRCYVCEAIGAGNASRHRSLGDAGC